MTPLTEATIKGAIEIGKHMTGHDDEWEVMLMVQTEEGAAALPVAPFFRDDHSKMMLAAHVLPQLIKDVEANEIVIVSPVWVGEEVGDDELETADRPTEEDHLYEALLVTSITHERIENHMATVTRSEDGPPVLGDFERPSTYLFGATGQIAIKAFETLKAQQG